MISINSKIIIYCDMDGVLTDFNSRVREIGYTGKLPGYDSKELWKLVISNGSKFWANMNWTSDGKQLWNYIKLYNVHLLTSVGKSLKSPLGTSAIKGKKEWISRELGDQYIKSAIFVAGKKYEYANFNSILIDDSKNHIDDFINHGGKAILHVNSNDTIKKLNKLLGELI